MITSATWYCRVLMSSKCAEITKNSCHMVAVLTSQAALMLIDFLFLISDSSDNSSSKKSKRESSFPSNQDPKRIRLGGTSLNFCKLFSFRNRLIWRIEQFLVKPVNLIFTN